MNYSDKLLVMNEWLVDNIDDVDGMCLFLDISVEDIVKCFPDAVVRAYTKAFAPDVDNNLEEDDEQEAWKGYRITATEED